MIFSKQQLFSVTKLITTLDGPYYSPEGQYRDFNFCGCYSLLNEENKKKNFSIMRIHYYYLDYFYHVFIGRNGIAKYFSESKFKQIPKFLDLSITQFENYDNNNQLLLLDFDNVASIENFVLLGKNAKSKKPTNEQILKAISEGKGIPFDIKNSESMKLLHQSGTPIYD